MARDYTTESLSHDPIHGYIPFVSAAGLPEGECAEQHVIDHPWVQRLRQIHQLQTAWYVFPSAEHMRFQHVLGAMHLASVVVGEWCDGLKAVSRNCPSKPYIESLVRMAALLHDVGHGPFGHFFDDQYLDRYGITHETLGAHIIENELGDLLRRIRRTPSGHLAPLEELEPKQIAWLIQRPRHKPGDGGDPTEGQPDWLVKLRALFSGIYTVDNMDFVLRDAYMTGYNVRAFDVTRLIHYTFFTEAGLTIHARGLPTLIHFIETRANLFRTVYFHRTVRAFDLQLEELFGETMPHLFPGNPLEHLDEYQRLTEWSFLVDVRRLSRHDDSAVRELGGRWERLLRREFTWKMAAERTVNFHSATAARTSIYSEPALVERRVRDQLPAGLRDVPLKIDVAQHYHRPSARLPAGGQNFMLDPGLGAPTELNDDELFRALPTSFAIFRIYTKQREHRAAVNKALSAVLGDAADAKTNM
jgi:hypothetical protein